MIFQIDIKTVLRYLSNIFLNITIVLFCLFFFGYSEELLILLVILFALDFFSSTYLFVEYYLLDKSKRVEILDNHLVLDKKGVKQIISADDIELIELTLSFAEYSNSYIRLMSLEYYYYVRIVLHSGDTIIMTSLLGRKLKEAILKLPVQIVKNRAFYCSIKH